MPLLFLFSFCIRQKARHQFSQADTHTEVWRIFLLSNSSPGSISGSKRCCSQQGSHSYGSFPVNGPGWGQSIGQKDFDEWQTGINPYLSLGLNFTDLRYVWEEKNPQQWSTPACKIAVHSQVPQLPSADGHVPQEPSITTLPLSNRRQAKKSLFCPHPPLAVVWELLWLSRWTKPCRLDLYW